MKIYIFAYLFPPEYTGASIQAITLAKALRRKGVQVTFVTATAADGKHDEKQHEGFPVIRIAPSKSSSNWSILCFWLRVVKVLFLNMQQYDVVHVIGPSTLHNIIPWVGWVLKKPTLVKTTLSDEIDQFYLPKQSGLERKFNFHSTKKYSRIICISHMIMNELARLTFPQDRLNYIPNGVDSSRFYPVNSEEKKQLRLDLGLPANGVLFSYVGVLDKRKNLEWLLKNWVGICNELDNIYLIIAGPRARDTMLADGGGSDFAGFLKNYVLQLDLRKKVYFLPCRKDVEKYFQLADFFINPSISEGLSNSMLEAMACGAIPVVSKTSGVEDVIDDGDDGFFFEINDGADFNKVVFKCCYGRGVNAEISKNAANKIKNQFSVETVCRRYREVYDDIVNCQ